MADDSSTYRRLVREVLIDIPYVDLVGVASNGQEALEVARERKPDLLTLDLEMPFMTGLEVLHELRSEKLNTGAIVLSAGSQQSAAATNQALRLGAFDFIVKPTGENAMASRELLREALESRLQEFAKARYGEKWNGRQQAPTIPTRAAAPIASDRAGQSLTPQIRPRIVVIGVSTGGPAALSTMLPCLPADLGVPILIVQHMPPLFTRSLADDLDRRCPFEVCEAQQGDVLRPGVAYIAPGGKHMQVAAAGAKRVLRITDDPPIRNCRPSVDCLFQSVAQIYRGAALAVVMTGMGDDGAEGCSQLKQYGARVIVQDEATSVVFGMPRRVIELNLADCVAPLSLIAGHITKAVGKSTREAVAP